MTSLIGIVIVDSLAWAAWSALVGYACHRLPADVLATDNFLTRPRQFEDDGRVYERMRIRKWKDRLPEAGALFPGGTSKRHLLGRSDAALRDFAAETRRAELVHWAAGAAVPVFALWNPPALFIAMAAYGAVANLPFIAVQRYNRARISRVLR